MATWKKAAIIVVAVPVVFVSILFYIGLGVAITHPTAFTTTRAAAPTSRPAAPPPTTTTTAPSTTTTVTSSSTTPTTHATTTTAAPTIASAQDRTAAAAILTASDQHYRDEFHQGQAIIGHTQYADAILGLSCDVELISRSPC